MFLEMFDYSFMVRALLAGVIIALIAPMIGGFLVAKRLSLIGDSLAHVSLAGVGIGLLAGIYPVVFAIPVAIFGSICLEWMRQNRKINSDVSLAILMSGGLSLALIFSNLAKGSKSDFNSYLFGSISTVTSADLWVLAAVAILVVAFIAWNYRALTYIAFDEDGARIAGYRVSLINYALAALTAIVVVSALQIVGGLLTSAILVIPVVIGSRLSNSFLMSMLISMASAVIAVVVGLTIAFYVGIAAGGAIVISALALLAFAMIWKS
jgi:zinc transport system permease protein